MPTPASTVGRAAGYPNYSDNFIPQIWSGKLLQKFYTATVFATIANTDYEGEIKNHGDTVFIRTVPNITIRDYHKGQDMIIENPDSGLVELNIDKAKYFAFTIDDIDAHQSDLALMNDWSNDAGSQMQITIDAGILGDIYTDAAAENMGPTAGKISGEFDLGETTSPITIDETNVLDALVDLGTVLDEQDRPDDNRWGVIPAWFAGKIKKSDLQDASLTGDGKSVLRNGRIGVIDRWTLYRSNQVASVVDTVNCWHTIFGHKSALSFAAQMTKMETLRSEKTFGDVIRGLNVYGYEVLQPASMAVLYCRK